MTKPRRTRAHEHPLLLPLALITVLLAVACGSPAQPTTTAPATNPTQYSALSTQDSSSPWQPEWDRTLAAAKQEGKVVVAIPTGSALREAMREFEAQYPEITFEYSALIGRDFGPRVIAERQGGLKLWDVYFGGVNSTHLVLRPAGAVVDLRPALILPEVKEDQYWYGGFEFGFTDSEKKYAYAFLGNVSPTFHINRRAMPVAEFNHARQLIEPRLKGTITWQDPRGAGSGAQRLSVLMRAYGEEFVTKLLTEQDVAFTRDPRQITEWVVRGRYPIGIAVRENDLAEFRAHGLARDVEPMEMPELEMWTPGFGAVSLMEGAPHPNAARVFINWLLSRSGQEALLKRGAEDNSRRTDVPVVSQGSLPKPEHLHQYVRNDEAWEPTRIAAEQLAQRLLK
jgi:iron(III) transport system substrate-binding protein